MTAIAQARPRTPPSPTSRWPPTPARSRPVHRPGRSGSPSTTSWCASRRTLTTPPGTPGLRRSPGQQRSTTRTEAMRPPRRPRRGGSRDTARRRVRRRLSGSRTAARPTGPPGRNRFGTTGSRGIAEPHPDRRSDSGRTPLEPGGTGGGRSGRAGGAHSASGPRRPASGLTSRAAVLGVVVCAIVVTLALPLRQYLGQRAEISRSQAQQAAQHRRVAELEARTRLHDTEPGETAYIVLQPAAPPAHRPSTDARAAPAPTDRAWYAQLWDGTVAAGTASPAARSPAPTAAP